MNMINGSLIDLLISAAGTLRNDTCRILAKYRTDIETEKKISERYKDESAYFQQEQSKLAAIAREGIEKAEKSFSEKISNYTGQMEAELKKHLSMPVNSQFREKLSMLSDFGIQPEKIEIDDLISLNGGNQIGLTALAKTLEKVNSPYVLKYHTTADYQNDIAIIRDLTRNLKYIPTEFHHEGCEIYKGITADYINENGGVIGGRISYDSVSLLANAVSFESSIEKIEEMKDVWAADCTYEEADRNAENEKEAQRLTNKYLTDAGLPPEEVSEPESKTKVEENPNNSEGMRIAREMGRNTAKARQTYDELMKYGQMK